jgi:hypothetical protein
VPPSLSSSPEQAPPYPPYPPAPSPYGVPAQPYPPVGSPVYGAPYGVSVVPASGVPVPISGYPAQSEAPLVTIGDMTVTKNWVIVPHGRYPLRGTMWTVQDSTQVTEGIPTWAIVCTIVFTILFCLFGLLFLLAKEKRYSGFVQVSVTGQGLYHSVQLPAGPMSGAFAASQVNQARALAAAAR